MPNAVAVANNELAAPPPIIEKERERSNRSSGQDAWGSEIQLTLTQSKPASQSASQSLSASSKLRTQLNGSSAAAAAAAAATS